MARDTTVTATCGWCITGHHADCRKTITFYDRTWSCPCVICVSDSENKRKKASKARKTLLT